MGWVCTSQASRVRVSLALHTCTQQGRKGCQTTPRSCFCAHLCGSCLRQSCFLPSDRCPIAQVAQSSKLSATLALVSSALWAEAGRLVTLSVAPLSDRFFATGATDTANLYYGFHEDAYALGAPEFSTGGSGPIDLIPATFNTIYSTTGIKTARVRVYDADPADALGTTVNVIAEAEMVLWVSDGATDAVAMTAWARRRRRPLAARQICSSTT